MKRLILLSMCSLACELLGSTPCPTKGDSGRSDIQAFDSLKNRTTVPVRVNPKITLEALLDTGDDTGRFTPEDAATIEGYVVDVKRGTLESCNCHSKVNRDWHIEIAATSNAKQSDRMIVEVTPRMPRAVSRKALVGKKVKVTGWLFFDSEHKQNSRNTSPHGGDVWRATAWEIHPVTNLQILQ